MKCFVVIIKYMYLLLYQALNSESLKKSVVKVFSTWGRLRDAHFLKYLEKNLTEQLDITRYFTSNVVHVITLYLHCIVCNMQHSVTCELLVNTCVLVSVYVH